MTARPLTQRQVALRQQLDAYAALGYLTWQPINRTIVSITPTGGTELHGTVSKDGLDIHEAELYVGGLANGARGRRVSTGEARPALDDTPASEPDPNDISYRPQTSCGCGYPLVWCNGEWQHDAAPYLWGDDHDPDEPEPTGPAREHWDAQDGVTGITFAHLVRH